MRTRASRVLLTGASTLIALFAVACIDLFHSTDFETLCTAMPMDPQCVVTPDAGPDTAMSAPDAADASRPHPDFCSWTRPMVFQQAEHACALLGACVGPLANPDSLGSSAFGACLFSAELAFNCTANRDLRPAGAADDFWSCISTATTCDEATQCVFPGGAESCKAVATGSFTACGTEGTNSTTQLKCGTSTTVLAATPCAMNGQTCAREDMSTGACVGAAGYACVTSGCSGTNANDCSGERDKGVDCAQMNAECFEDVPHVPGCSPTSTLAPACSAYAAPSCTGTLAQACLHDKLVSIDCSVLGDGETGLGCDVTTAPPNYAIANACTAVSPVCATTGDTCVSSLLSVCVHGLAVQYDCSQLTGYTTCVNDAENGPHCAAAK